VLDKGKFSLADPADLAGLAGPAGFADLAGFHTGARIKNRRV